VASLRELQQSFAASLRDPAAHCAVMPPGNLDIYRNNASITFRVALERTFPVVLRRVGEDYFRQLAFHYRARFPSRNGDLHWIGRDFPTFLAEHLESGDYAWLADLARLEWARAESGVAMELPSVEAARLADIVPEILGNLVFTLQPSLRLVSSAFPVFSVWHANQGAAGPPVDQSLGAERGFMRNRGESIEVSIAPPDLFSYLSATHSGATLAEAAAVAKVDSARLTEILALVFTSGLVTSFAVKAPP
jgi:hypothetical protein